ncbi:hypothetical protein [Thiohalophilus sp.]|uniref:hypothetical protein n=1 Tax=Thiohalophilus sp. TaxID=3028392 RepID=UPI002ACEB32C|nr:hypothetical protein [Thiohalophilus sp.]MDZ7802558.1 hypothetical protein [Thiohalophilus sp.]
MMRLKLSLLSLVFFFITACAGNPESTAALQCERGLETAYKELDFAKAKGLGGTMEYTKAASLLTAAKIQFEFGKYPNCIDKVKRARAYIRVSQQ